MKNFIFKIFANARKKVLKFSLSDCYLKIGRMLRWNRQLIKVVSLLLTEYLYVELLTELIFSNLSNKCMNRIQAVGRGAARYKIPSEFRFIRNSDAKTGQTGHFETRDQNNRCKNKLKLNSSKVKNREGLLSWDYQNSHPGTRDRNRH